MSIGISIWDMCYRYEIWYINMVVYHIDMVILDVVMGYGLMIWEMKVSIRSSSISIWDILSLCLRDLVRHDRLLVLRDGPQRADQFGLHQGA